MSDQQAQSVNIDASIAAIQREIDQRIGVIMFLQDVKAKGLIIVPAALVASDPPLPAPPKPDKS